MYVSIGPGAVARRKDIVGIFDMDNATWSHRTRKSLAVCERAGIVAPVGDDLPRALVVCSEKRKIREKRRRRMEHAPDAVIYMTQLSAQTLLRRGESEQI